MLIPDREADVELFPLKVHALKSEEIDRKSTLMRMIKDATVSEVVEATLDNLEVDLGPEFFELYEVYNGNGLFPDDADFIYDNGRMLKYHECPVKVVQAWITEEVKPLQENGEVVEKRRLYIVQKKSENSMQTSDIKVKWLDGHDSKQPSGDWTFDPFNHGEDEINDLVNLPVLNENVMLEELFKRFCLGRIYTYVGGILIALNPFKYFPIYNPKYVKAYQHRKLGELPPHVFAIADSAYNDMLREKQDQCIVISGESGSGKTESTKLILHHLTALSHKTKATILEKTILAAGPVLEAFGNAKTCHNDNSSRFGKFTQINYRADGVVCGAVQKKYLLEKSRIVQQAGNERNYHVFYYLLAGSSDIEKQTLQLKDPKDYHYLNQTASEIANINEEYEFMRLKHSIKNLGISHSLQQRMFSVLSAVLHIGNITFKKRGLHEDAVCVADDTIIETISNLLQVEKHDLIQPLTFRKTITRGEEYIRFYRKDEAIATRDSMAKCLYASLFDWIVLQTNHVLLNRQGQNNDKKAFSIGVLDIFGFEDFEHNSFEQFCINLANENLQYYLNQHIFKLRQDEYITEGLSWDHVDYVDNTTCLNLMVGRPVGLIQLLDEECSLTMGTDKSLLEKFNKHHADNAFYEMPPTREPVFTIIHYAGKVKYKIWQFRTKNRDLMRGDIITAFKSSRMLFMRELMGSDPVAIYYWSVLRHTIKATAQFRKAAREADLNKDKQNDKIAELKKMQTTRTPPSRRKVLAKMSEGNPDNKLFQEANRVMNRRVFSMTKKKYQNPAQMRSGLEVKKTISNGMTETMRRKGGLKTPPTVVAQFQSSLQELMETLNQSHPLFVRCIRSNAQKAPLEFDAELVLRQLRYTGMLETIKIRQAGYSGRIPKQDFIKQFNVLFPSYDEHTSTSHHLTNLLVDIGLDPAQFQIGATKVFMRESQYRLLHGMLQTKCNESAATIQRCWLAYHQWKQFKDILKAVRDIQRVWRGHQGRKWHSSLRLQHMAARHILQFWRHHKLRRETETPFAVYKKSVIKIQAFCRGYLARQQIKKMKIEEKERKEIIEKSESLMKQVFKDTIFTEKDTTDDDSKTDGTETETESEAATVFDETNYASRTSKSENKQPPVKLRNEQRNEADFKQKLIRRLSFTSKEKRTVLANRRDKTCASRDFDDFDIITGPPLGLLDSPHKKPTTNSHHHKDKPFGFLSGLQRRGSKRENLTKDKRRRSANIEHDLVVKGERELEVFNEFLFMKTAGMKNAKSDSEVDTVFKNALNKYHGNLLLTCANTYQRKETITLKIEDLLKSFQNVLDQMVNQDKKISKEFSVIGSNLFQGIVEEFMNQKEKLVMKKKPRRHHHKGRRRKEEIFDHNSHLYQWQHFNIRTYCEYCNTFIYEKGLICQACTFTCHKKCHTKYPKSCKGRRPSVCGPASLYGTDLNEITSPNNPIPEAITLLIKEIEKRALFSLGLYRKPGNQADINNLKSTMTSVDAEELLLEDEKPNTLASMLKLFFRQLPKAVILEEFYEDFIRSTDLESTQQTYATLYELIQRFPKANKELLERLIVHLASLARHEEVNLMSPNALAIIWAPCLMRPPKDTDPLETLKHLPKQTKCIEVLIEVQVTSGKEKIDDINVLHRAASSAEKRIANIIQSQLREEGEETTDCVRDNEELAMLQMEVSTFDAERQRLTTKLARLEPGHKSRSINSLDELDGSDFEVIDDSNEEELAASVSSSPVTKKRSHDKRALFIAGAEYDSSFEEVTDNPPVKRNSKKNNKNTDHTSKPVVHSNKPEAEIPDSKPKLAPVPSEWRLVTSTVD